MAPKARQPKGKAKSRAAGAGVSVPSSLPASIANVNASYLADVQQWFSNVAANPILNQLAGATLPLTVEQGGRLAPFDHNLFKPGLERAATTPVTAETVKDAKPFYTSGGVLQWLNPMWTATPGVQINRSTVQAIADRNFPPKDPRHFPIGLVASANDAEYMPMEHKGGMKCVSPMEYVHAAYMACDRDLADPSCDDELVRRWSNIFRDVSISFMFVPENLESLSSFQQREASAPKLSQHFLTSVLLSSRGETFSPSFIDAALTVESRVLADPVVGQILQELDDSFGSSGPLNSVHKLQAVINRGKTAQGIQWTFKSIADSIKMRYLEAGEITATKINRLHGDVAMLKMEVRDYRLHIFLEKHAFTADAKRRLREVLHGHDSARRCLAAYPDQKQVEISWQATLPGSARKFCDFAEAVIYGDSHDASLKTAVKYSKGAPDFLGCQLAKEDLDTIIDCVEKEAAQDSLGIELPKDDGSFASTPSKQQWKVDEIIHFEENGETDKLAKKVQELNSEERDNWLSVASKYVRIAVMPDDPKTLVSEIKSSDLATTAGDMTGLALLHFDTKLAGEAATAPRIRKAPFQEKSYNTQVSAVLEGRFRGVGDQPTLGGGGVVLVVDGGRLGSAKPLKKPRAPPVAAVAPEEKLPEGDEADDDLDGDGEKELNRMTLKHHVVHVIASEETLKANRKLSRGPAGLQQVEDMHVLTVGNLALPERAGKHYDGSDKGTVIGPVTLPTPEKEWRTSAKNKREIYTKKNRIPVGGKAAGLDAPEKRSDTDIEPVFGCTFPVLFYLEVLRRFFGRTVVDLAPGPGNFAEAALRRRTGLFGIAMSQKHAPGIEGRLKLVALAMARDPESLLYNAKSAEAMGETKKEVTHEPKKAKRKFKGTGKGAEVEQSGDKQPPKKKLKGKGKVVDKDGEEPEPDGDEEADGSNWDLSGDDGEGGKD
ncbi:unnamed protein product [Prorocentrum cordatum]|uniref:Uncharacterized protein n=1 Tax=Prorocentrum cordatum TaxID=2364126 RepID=A0ABN9TA56_9DINO|nr:unnamed protein product [Polarella glacialis]